VNAPGMKGIPFKGFNSYHGPNFASSIYSYICNVSGLRHLVTV